MPKLILPSALAIFVVEGAGCGVKDDFAPEDDEYFGDNAMLHLSHCVRDEIPWSISDLWVFDAGSFGGSIYYASFKCETLSDCWTAVSAFGSPEKPEFKDGIQTVYAVNQHGPSFYHKGYSHPKWNLSAIDDGVSCEKSRADRWMEFWAIDRDQLRVYFHYESGGFPQDPPSVRHGR